MSGDTNGSTAPFTTARDDALGDMDMVDLLAALKKRTISPEELREAALGRARDANAELNAVVHWIGAPTVAPGSENAPLHGIPTFLKDNESIAGHPTSYGSAATPDTPMPKSTVFADEFAALGFDILGKSNLPEFGLTATTEPLRFGPTRNPWNRAHSVGGSSGGSAALVSSRVVPIAHANDGGGSIRIPASCCGLVGLKPSRGRLAMPESMERAPVKISTQGVLTRSVRDTAAFYAAMEKIRHDLPRMGHIKGPNPERLRIAFFTEGISGTPVSPDVVAAVEEAATLCEGLGHHVERIRWPYGDQLGRDFLRYWGLLSLSISLLGGTLFEGEFDRTKLEPLTLGLGGFARSMSANIPGSLVRLRRFSESYESLFDKHDVILSPVLGTPPPPIGYLAPDLEFRTHVVRLLRFAGFTAVQNVSGAPAISLPLARSAEGLPIGVQAATSHGQDARLISLAYELEAASPHWG